jgi:AcrR family transcriptional regulator
MGRPQNLSRSEVIARSIPLFANKGFSALSVDELVKSAGATRGFIYTTFGSKLGLFRECYERVRESSSKFAAQHLDLMISALREAENLGDGFILLIRADLNSLGERASQVLGTHMIERLESRDG